MTVRSKSLSKREGQVRDGAGNVANVLILLGVIIILIASYIGSLNLGAELWQLGGGEAITLTEVFTRWQTQDSTRLRDLFTIALNPGAVFLLCIQLVLSLMQVKFGGYDDDFNSWVAVVVFDALLALAGYAFFVGSDNITRLLIVAVIAVLGAAVPEKMITRIMRSWGAY